MSEKKPVANRKREPTALSIEYHKAHKQLMLWSAILFIWEFIGIDLSKVRDAAGYVGPIVAALKSPQAVPWALLLLVVYFLVKSSLEWAQCNVERRKVPFARADYVLGITVAVAALTLYLVQAVSRVQIANILSRLNAPSFLLGATIAFLIVIGAVEMWRLKMRAPIEISSGKYYEPPSSWSRSVFFLGFAAFVIAFLLGLAKVLLDLIPFVCGFAVVTMVVGGPLMALFRPWSAGRRLQESIREMRN